MRQKFHFCVFLYATLLFGSEIDPIFVPQRTFSSAVTRGFGDAGVALVSGLSAGILNPALVNAYRKEIQQTHGSVTAGFGRDSLYSKSIIPAGASYSAEDGSMALFYRFLANDRYLSHNEITINLSGLLFQQSEDQGAVDFGANLRLEHMNWKRKTLLPLPTITSFKDTAKHRSDTTFTDASTSLSGELRQSSLILDLGFFQPQIMPNVDFGLTLKNITGFTWSTIKPSTGTLHDTLHSDSTILDSSYYVNLIDKSKQWFPSRYKTLTAGIAYYLNVKENAFLITLPMDIEILGLFDKKMKNLFVFKGGIEALFANKFALRLGYSRAPGILMKGFSEIKNLNFFTGGGGVRIDPLKFDFYIANNAFGTTLSFDY